MSDIENQKVIGIDYEAECKRIQQQMFQREKEINDEWEKRYVELSERSGKNISKLQEERDFYKNIIKSVLHIQ